SDSGGGYDLTNVRSNEWLHYSINVAVSGTYLLQARVASTGTGGTFRMETDGDDVTGLINIPNTGGAWQTVTVSNIIMTAGAQVLRLYMISDGASGLVGKFNYVSFSLATS